MSNDRYCTGCGEGASGFIIKSTGDALYTDIAIPCPVCNPDPPRLGEKRPEGYRIKTEEGGTYGHHSDTN